MNEIFSSKSLTETLSYSNRDYENQLRIARENYEERLEQLTDKLKAVYDEIRTDEILAQMRANPSTAEFAGKKMYEIVEKYLGREQEESISKLITNLSRAKSNVMRLENELVACKEQIYKLDDENSSNRHQIQNLEYKNQELKQKLAGINNIYEENFKQSTDHAQHALRSSHQEIERLKEKANKLEQLCNKYIREMEKMTNLNDDLSQEVAKLQAKIQKGGNGYSEQGASRFEAYYHQITENNNELANQVLELKGQIRVLEEQREHLSEQCQEYETRLKETLEEEQKDTSNLLRQVHAKYQEKSRRFKKKIIEQRELLFTLEQELENAKLAVDSSQNSYAKHVSSWQNDIHKLSEQWKRKYGEMESKYQQEISDLKSSYETHIKSLSATHDSQLKSLTTSQKRMELNEINHEYPTDSQRRNKSNGFYPQDYQDSSDSRNYNKVQQLEDNIKLLVKQLDEASSSMVELKMLCQEESQKRKLAETRLRDTTYRLLKFEESSKSSEHRASSVNITEQLRILEDVICKEKTNGKDMSSEIHILNRIRKKCEEGNGKKREISISPPEAQVQEFEEQIKELEYRLHEQQMAHQEEISKITAQRDSLMQKKDVQIEHLQDNYQTCVESLSELKQRLMHVESKVESMFKDIETQLMSLLDMNQVQEGPEIELFDQVKYHTNALELKSDQISNLEKENATPSGRSGSKTERPRKRRKSSKSPELRFRPPSALRDRSNSALGSHTNRHTRCIE